MQGLILRAAGARDLEDICRVWETSFGDAPETVKSLLEPKTLENTVIAELYGRARSLMTAFDGLDFGGVRASYILALCTQPEYRGRGLGALVLDETASRAFARGAELVCLRPASESLARWYARLGFRTLSRALAVSPARDVACAPDLRRVSAGEYAALRADARPRVPEALLRAQELLYTGAEGGLFALDGDVGNGCACVQCAGSSLEIRELVCPESLKADAAAAVSERFGRAARLIQILPPEAERGNTHLMGLWKDGENRELTHSVYLPFTLD